MRHAFDRLIIFDYSGTLSLEAPAFARPERLLRELEISGLHDLGIRTPGLFWERVVNPTWEEGSTTTVGYREILRREVERLFPERVRSARQDWIRQAASRFVDHYLEHSRMDWRRCGHPRAACRPRQRTFAPARSRQALRTRKPARPRSAR